MMYARMGAGHDLAAAHTGNRTADASSRNNVAGIHVTRCSLLTVTFALLCSACSADVVAPLPAMKLDPTRVAVTGISSGAAMAQQVHFAYSDRIAGAALLAGSPYGCAENSLDVALSRCIKGQPDGPDAVHLAERARTHADAGKIAPLSGLDGDRVLVMHGKQDMLVAETVTRASWAIYAALAREVAVPPVQGLDLHWDGDGAFAHVWPTVDAGGDCGTTVAPYIGRCGIDAAGQIFRRIFGARSSGEALSGESASGETASGAAPSDETPLVAKAPAGELLPFDQTQFLPAGNDAYLDTTGLIYRPTQCTGDKACGLLIAFHGCEQNRAAIGDVFARDSGLNRWADVYDVVVLYPQTRATYMPLNPKACWDWWGYSGAEYDTRDGLQLRWLANVTARLGVPLAD